MIIKGRVTHRALDGATTVLVAERDWVRAGEPSDVRIDGRTVRAWRGFKQPGGELDVHLGAHIEGFHVELEVATSVRADGAISGRCQSYSGTEAYVDVRTADYFDSPLAPGRAVLLQDGRYAPNRSTLASVTIRGAVVSVALPVREPARLSGSTVWIVPVETELPSAA